MRRKLTPRRKQFHKYHHIWNRTRQRQMILWRIEDQAASRTYPAI